MNSLTLQVRLATRCLASASRVYSRSLSSSRGLFQNTTPDKAEEDESNAIIKFHEKGIISEPVYDALTKLNFENFTPVQSKTIGPLTVGEKGIIARAKTGTGKTLAFGLPLIEKALKRDPRSKDVVGLIISPTRDLAYQIRDELNKVVRSFDRKTPHINIHCLVGAEPKFGQIKAFTRHQSFPHIVVATPGRLYDMMENPMIQRALAGIEFKVLDEADRLLDDGFKDSLLEIETAIKDAKAQNNGKQEKTLLFSATIDRNVMTFAEDLMGNDLNYIDCVDKDAPETHEKVEQSLISTNNLFESFTSACLFIENEAKANKNSKVVVFLPTVKCVSYFKETLAQYLNTNNVRTPVFELHGKLSQSQRDRSVRQFRERSKGVLVTSDVGARGMDFPGVTNVVQIGVPTDTTNYVHRIGRTARGGKSGQALLILTKAEGPFVKVLLDRHINIAKQYAYEKIEESEAAITEASVGAIHKFSPDDAIGSLCGFYNGVTRNYRLNLKSVLADITGAYSNLVGEPHKLPRVGPTLWRTVLGLRNDEAQRYFDIESRRDFGGSFGEDRTPNFRNDRGVNRGYGQTRGQKERFSKRETYSGSQRGRGGYERSHNNRSRGGSSGYSRGGSNGYGDF